MTYSIYKHLKFKIPYTQHEFLILSNIIINEIRQTKSDVFQRSFTYIFKKLIRLYKNLQTKKLILVGKNPLNSIKKIRE